jgi:hypothetical protein
VGILGSYDWNGRGINELEPLPGVSPISMAQITLSSQLLTSGPTSITAPAMDWPPNWIM